MDSVGNAYVTGFTYSTDFPTANAFQPAKGSPPFYDAFVASLDSTGTPIYSSYLGGSDGDQGNGIAVDNAGNAYVTGFTSSVNFPTVNSFQPTNHGNGDAFVTKVGP